MSRNTNLDGYKCPYVDQIRTTVTYHKVSYCRGVKLVRGEVPVSPIKVNTEES